MGIIILLLQLAIIIVVIAGIWKAFEKAGQPGWAAIVPIYNIYVMTQIAGKPAWWIVMFIIPIANIIFAFMLHIEIAKKFGKDTGFGIGLTLLGFIFWPILGFGNAEYDGRSLEDADHFGA